MAETEPGSLDKRSWGSTALSPTQPLMQHTRNIKYVKHVQYTHTVHDK